jgi:uncharacterized membrane protein
MQLILILTIQALALMWVYRVSRERKPIDTGNCIKDRMRTF